MNKICILISIFFMNSVAFAKATNYVERHLSDLERIETLTGISVEPYISCNLCFPEWQNLRNRVSFNIAYYIKKRNESKFRSTGEATYQQKLTDNIEALEALALVELRVLNNGRN